MNMEKHKKIVWVISDGIAGHYRQSEGVVLALKSICDVDETWLTIKLKNGLYRQMLKWLLNRHKLSVSLLKSAYANLDLPETKPDIIIGAGGKSMYAVAMLAQHYQAKSIFVGSLRGLNPDLFNIIFTLDEHQHPNYVRLDVAPMPINQQTLQLAQQQWLEKSGISLSSKKIYALLIGGDGAGLYYTEQDWINLADMMNRIAQQFNIQWLLTTSRRTPVIAEQILAQNLQENAILECVYWHQEPKKVIQAYLSMAEQVFVTAESMTMITEAVYSYKPVLTLLPLDLSKIDKSHEQHLTHLVNKGYIQYIKMNESVFEWSDLANRNEQSFLQPIVNVLKSIV